MTTFEQSIAKIKDLDAISRLVNSAYRGESGKKGWTTESDLLGGQRTDPETLRQTVMDANTAILLLWQGCDLIACVCLQRLEKNPGSAYLGMLTVKPDIQAQGIGRDLLQRSEEFVRKSWQANRIEMTVIKQRTELIAWYKRRGYRATERRESFPYGDARFGLPKISDLEFIIFEKNLE